MVKPIAGVTFTILSAYGILAQSVATSPAFEVATIKPANPDARGMSFRMEGEHRFTINNHTLKEVIATSYDLAPRLISGGPAWVDTDRYDMVGVMPGDMQASSEERQLMMRALMAERFNLKYHREFREAPVYNLVLGKAGRAGLKITESPNPDQNHSLMMRGLPNRAIRLPVRRATMADLAAFMQRVIVDRSVIDKTGLTAKYDFDLEWTPDNAPPGPSDADTKPDIFTALQRFGLRLESAKGQVAFLVIDHVDRPSDN
jgi:uncharacterized protein (TIGR03435 family)